MGVEKKVKVYSAAADLIRDGLAKHGQVRTVFRGSSMEPTLKEGMLLFVKAAAPSDIRAGNIILYGNSKGVIAHRVIKIIKKNNGVIFITKGDNHAYVDCLRVPEAQLIGVVRGAFRETRPHEDILIHSQFVDYMFVALGLMVLTTRSLRSYLSENIRRPFKRFVGGFFHACMKCVHFLAG